MVETVHAGVLETAFERSGDPAGPPVVLLHGFPYDVRAYDRVAARLAERGAHVIVPYLRGYGPTRFLDDATMRSGQQAALAQDLLDLLAALDLAPAVLAGYDWGGRAACIAAMLEPERVAGLVTVDGYNVQDLARAAQPAEPEQERHRWYQYYLHGERGRTGLERHRREFARVLWREWSPEWAFSDEEFDATAPSFDNPDFVDVVVHSYRHRYGLVDGDPAYAQLEARIAQLPPVRVPTVVVDATRDGLGPPPDPAEHRLHFPHLVANPQLSVGHATPQEAPRLFADAVALLRF
ncbi:alpha/beta fold hydrolase [Amnibacterium endophyticum]|uniref:Alpha/beta fold hydrolase n=1 Tax=Amnibacterium endophyticum TaxID=2109337 RepID=A0ABW4LI22_9MICO